LSFSERKEVYCSSWDDETGKPAAKTTAPVQLFLLILLGQLVSSGNFVEAAGPKRTCALAGPKWQALGLIIRLLNQYFLGNAPI
jgi:hypothetical protein